MKFFNIFNFAKTTFYNNTSSQLVSENVQDAIDELDNKVDNIEGSNLGYSYDEDLNDPKTSDTVKKALDRIITNDVAVDDGTLVKNDTDTFTSTPAITNIISLTQAEYDAIVTPDVNTLYVINV